MKCEDTVEMAPSQMKKGTTNSLHSSAARASATFKSSVPTNGRRNGDTLTVYLQLAVRGAM
jgi:hypothetical protein